jgi:hypothetical protein
MNPEELRAELVFLRKGPGVTPSKLAVCPTLMSHEAVAAHQNLAARVVEAEELLGRVLKELPDRRGNALRNAWELSGSVAWDTLTDRRISFASQRQCSPETVKTWENQAITDAVLLLQRGETVALSVAPNGAPPSAGALQVEAADVRLLVRPRTGIESIEQRLTVRALVDGVKEFRRGVWSSARPLVAEDVEVLHGARLIDVVKLKNDGRQLVFEFPRAIAAGKPHSFSWRRRLGAPDPSPYWTYNPQHRPVDLHVSATFESSVPPLVWAVDNLFVRESPGLPSGTNVITHAGSNFYPHTFVSMPGKESGIAWEW